jgi:hypothetical protein
MSSLGKHPEHQRADDEAFRRALDKRVNHGASWWDIVPELRQAYRENLRDWAPSEYRDIERMRRDRAR